MDRTKLFSLTLALLTVASTAGMIGALAAPPAAPNPDIDVDLSLGEGEGAGAGISPIWWALGGVVLLLIIVLAVMAARSGGDRGTTVVRG